MSTLARVAGSFAIAAHASPNGAHEVHVAVVCSDPSLPAGEIGPGHGPDRSTAGVHGTAKILAVAERAVDDVTNEVLTSRNGHRVGWHMDRVDGGVVRPAQFPFARGVDDARPDEHENEDGCK